MGSDEWQFQPISSTDAKAFTLGTPSFTSEADTDLDGLNNWRKFLSGTFATVADSDLDGINDSTEFSNVLNGLDPRAPNNLNTVFGQIEQRGKDAVVANPSMFSLYNATTIQDLRGTGNLLIQAANNKVTLRLPVEKSTNLNDWSGGGELLLELDQCTFPSKQFFRFDSVLGD